MNRQICPLCALEDDLLVFDDPDTGQSVFRCDGPACDGHTWTPRHQETASSKRVISRTGLGEEFGVYDDLLACIGSSDVWLEYGIIEHRYRLMNPRGYGQMIDRWGHRAKAPSKYTLSSFLGGCLGQLAREGAIAYRRAPTTGYWAYLGGAGHVARLPSPGEDATLTWEEFAVAEGLDPQVWVL